MGPGMGTLCTVGAGFVGRTMIQDDHGGLALSPEQAQIDQSGPHAA
jgi:hypothetical protein